MIGTDVLKGRAAQGAIWISLTSAISMPLAYYRNWVLSRTGADGEVLGTYALLLILVQVVVTFVLFGGGSAVTNFLPRIERREKKAAFLLGYGAISIGSAAIFMVMLTIWPDVLAWLTRKEIDTITLITFVLLTPVVILSHTAIFFLTGLMQFKLSSLLGMLQVCLVSVVATVGLVFMPGLMAAHSLFVLTSTLGVAHLTIFFFGGRRVLMLIKSLAFKTYFPKGFWRFAAYVHVSTVTFFIYQNIDQLFVLAVLGVKELGVYFVMLQCAQLITLLPQRIGQVMLSSFSHLRAMEEHEVLKHGYVKLCRMILILSTSVALSLAFLSEPISGLFGEFCQAKHKYLISLAVAINIGSLGSVNSMLVMSKERTGYFMVNSFLLIGIQVIVTWILMSWLGTYGAIIGKAAGIVAGQIGLFSIVRWRIRKIGLGPPREYWISQAFMFVAAGFCLMAQSRHVLFGLVGLAVSFGCYLVAIGFHLRELKGIRRPKEWIAAQA